MRYSRGQLDTFKKRINMIQLVEISQDECLGVKPELIPVSGTWIAGGSIRQWFFGKEKPSDIDVFGSSEDALKFFVEENLFGSKKLVERDNLVSYNHHGKLVQIIKHSFPKSAEELLDSFDFNVCQFCWNGAKIFSTVSAISSVLRGGLKVHKIQKGFQSDSLRRAFKYQEKGYKPCLGTIRDLGKAFVGISEEEINKQIEISPGGGMRAVGVD